MPATPGLASLFARHERAVLAFSGGKDSLVCLDLCRDYRDKLEVIWVNTGAMFPHMVEFVREATKGFNLVELHSDQARWIEQQGLPADLVPVANSSWRMPPNTDSPAPPKTMVQPWTACCAKLRFRPLLEYLAQSDATLFIHGQRHADGGGFSADSAPGAKVEICKLIWGWSDSDVMAHIAEHGIELPEQYGHGVIDSLECWSCTARAGDSAAKMATKFAYMAKEYPDLFEELKRRMGEVYIATEAAFEDVRVDAMVTLVDVAEKVEAAPAPEPAIDVA